MSNYQSKAYQYPAAGPIEDSAGIQVLSGADGANWNPLYCTASSDGVQVNIVTAVGDGTHAATTSKSFTAVDASRMAQTLSFDLYWDPRNPATATALQVALGDYTNYYYHDFDLGRIRPGWNRVVIPVSKFAVGGAPSWASIAAFRTRLLAGSGEVYRYSIMDVRLGEYSRPVVLVQFDDCVANWYSNGWPVIQALGVPVTLHAIANLIGTGGYMTLAQLAEVYAAGHDVANHTDDHTNLSTADYATALEHIEAGQDWLVSNGFTRRECHRFLAWPYGLASTAAQQAAADLGVISARRVYGDAWAHELLDQRYMTACYNIANTTTVANVKTVIQNAIAGGGVVRLLMHKIVASPSAADEWSIANLTSLCAWLRALDLGGVITLMTESQWYEGLGS